MKLIVSADDFGLSPAVNDAVIRAFNKGLINRATAIANAPFFDEACQLAHANGIQDRIGMHFNITEGMPISSAMAGNPLFCSTDGRFRGKRRLFLSKTAMMAVAAECEDQILRFHHNRLHPVHLNSHHHVHTIWLIFRAIEPVLKRNGFSSVRISRNIGDCSISKRAYKALFNRYLKRGGWRAEDYFGRCIDVLEYGRSCFTNGSVVEVMVHPTIGSDGALIDAISGEELGTQLSRTRGVITGSLKSESNP